MRSKFLFILPTIMLVFNFLVLNVDASTSNISGDSLELLKVLPAILFLMIFSKFL